MIHATLFQSYFKQYNYGHKRLPQSYDLWVPFTLTERVISICKDEIQNGKQC